VPSDPLTEEDEDEAETEAEWQDWQVDMRRFLLRYYMLMWIGAPVMAFVQIWVSNRDHPITGSGWIGPAIVAAFFVPIWLAFGWLFRLFGKVFADQDEAADLARRARTAERKLAIRRAERLERAEIRLARITEDRRAAESQRLALDVDRIRRELDTDGDGRVD
jgi:hypothetical protein